MINYGTPLSCLPTYDYEPLGFIPSNVNCVAPGFDERRSRLTVSSTSMFFRSKEQGQSTNCIEIELIGTVFNTYFNGDFVSTSSYTNVTSISTLRTNISNNVTSIIEMPALGADIYDNRISETVFAGFTRRFLVGGSGPPEDSVGLSLIRTGPSRTMCVVHSREGISGSSVAVHQPYQWNGSMWIPYSNALQGGCPI